MTKHERIVLICVATSIIFILGCSPGNNFKVNKYGSAFNQRRFQLGIPPLSVKWQLGNCPTNQITWYNPSYREHTPCHLYKTLTFDIDRLASEDNEYVSGKEFSSEDPDGGKDPECLSMKFNFTSSNFSNGVWECKLKVPTGIANITFDTATNLIHEWKINEN